MKYRRWPTDSQRRQVGFRLTALEVSLQGDPTVCGASCCPRATWGTQKRKSRRPETAASPSGVCPQWWNFLQLGHTSQESHHHPVVPPENSKPLRCRSLGTLIQTMTRGAVTWLEQAVTNRSCLEPKNPLMQARLWHSGQQVQPWESLPPSLPTPPPAHTFCKRIPISLTAEPGKVFSYMKQSIVCAP